MIAVSSGLRWEEHIAHGKQFEEFQKRITVSTDLFGRGIDIERVNIAVDCATPDDSDSYLNRAVGPDQTAARARHRPG